MQIKMVLKLVVLGVVSVLMLIALAAIGGITSERKGRMYEVQRNIADSYADSQRIIAPIFSVTYRETWVGKLYNKEKNLYYDKEMAKVRTANIYPDQLQYDGSLSVQERYRGIFKANVYQSEGRIEGAVTFPVLESFRSEASSELELISIEANILISDARGISKIPTFEWIGEELSFSPGSIVDDDYSGIHASLPNIGALLGKTESFAMDLNIHGMGLFEVVPIGSENRIRIASSWPHPSFVGSFLATTRTITDDGFEAEWNVNGLACSAQQDLTAGKTSRIQRLGVSLIDPVNPYPLTDRALKYGFLFIFITFAAFLLFELVKQLKIHPIQYGFVGLAQAFFFLLLLSLSEHIDFGLSYAIASFTTISVISVYLCSVLRGFKRGLFFGAVLSVLYGALFGLLQSEDHALVAGSSLLFGLISLAMLLTRKVDWYAIGESKKKLVTSEG